MKEEVDALRGEQKKRKEKRVLIRKSVGRTREWGDLRGSEREG